MVAFSSLRPHHHPATSWEHLPPSCVAWVPALRFASWFFSTEPPSTEIFLPPGFVTVLPFLQRVFCVPLHSFPYTQQIKPLITSHPLCHFFPPTIISNHPSPAAQFQLLPLQLASHGPRFQGGQEMTGRLGTWGMMGGRG